MEDCIRRFSYIDNNVDTSQRYKGWQLENTPNFDPMDVAYGVTHDALEHHNPGEEGIENEMMAFGALYHIRVLGGWWDQFNLAFDPEMMVAWDMARFLSERDYDIADNGAGLPPSIDAMLCRVLEHYKVRLATHHKVYKDNPDYVKALHAFRKAGSWLSEGYLRSLNRWKGHNPKQLCDLFNSITHGIERIMTPRHGDVLEIRFNTENLNHKVYHTCNG